MFQPLRNPSFRWLWFSQVISQSGDQLRNWAIIFWVFTASGQSPVTQSLVLMTEYLPAALIGPLAGVFVDRWNRHRVMKTTHLLRGVLSLCLIPVVLSGNIPILLILIGLSSVVSQFFMPATGAVTRSLLPQDQFMAANSLIRATSNTLTLAGPVIATVIYQSFGPQTTFLIDGFTFFLAAGCLMFVRYKRPVTAVPVQTVDESDGAAEEVAPSFWRELLEGLRYGWQNQTTRMVLIVITTLSFGAGLVNLLGIFLVQQELKLPEFYVALSSTLQAVGMISTALLFGFFSKKLTAYRRIIWLSNLLLAGGIILLALSPNAWVMLTSRVLIGVGITALNIAMTTLLMMEVPEHLLGRIGALLETAPTYAVLFTLGLSSYLVLLADTRTLLFAGGLMFVLAAAVSVIQKKQATPAEASVASAHSE